jgi:prophage antirepressor-like protein
MERIMNTITFNDVELHLQTHPQHEFLLTNKEVALGYGITQSTLRSNLNNNKDELIEGKHWLRLEVQTRGGKQSVIHWTKKGIVRLGFFIKSQKAKAFRDWAEDYIVKEQITPTQLDLITPYEVRRDLATARRKLTIEKNKHKNLVKLYEKTLNENETLKQKMKQQLSLIVTNVSDEIVTRFEESLDVTARGIELRK